MSPDEMNTQANKYDRDFTERMSKAGAYISAWRHSKTGEYHGVIVRNHPTPSGCERWLLAYSTASGFATEREARAAMVSALTPEGREDIPVYEPEEG